jgi:hypothetical protein
MPVPFTFLNYALINTLIALDQGKVIAGGSGLAVLFSSKIGFEVNPNHPYFHVPASSGSLLESSTIRSADRLPDGSLFKSSMKSSGPTVSWYHGLPCAGIRPWRGMTV